MKYEQVVNILSQDVRKALEMERLQFDYLQEIRLRIGYPIVIIYRGNEHVLTMVVKKHHIKETLDYVSDYSLYAFENEMRQGFITVEGGHRVGMAGQVLVEHGQVKNMKQVSSLNIRISHEIQGCADELIPYLTYDMEICHTLIISPPRCGKTTILRDLIRQISNGNKWVRGQTVGVVDERSELAGCYHGIPQNHMGMRTDVLDACPKAEGMLMLVRSMSPKVIAVDEIGDPKEIQAIKYAMYCGCKMIATVHGESLEDIKRKPLWNEMICEQCFERYVVLGNQRRVGEIRFIYNRDGERICCDG